MRYLLLAIFICLWCFSPDAAFAQKKKKGKKRKGEESVAQQSKKPEKPKSAIKPFEEIITEDAVSDTGLITLHKVSGNYFFEIADSLLEREILLVSRISGTVQNLNFGGAGMKARPQQVVRFQRHEEQIVLRSVSYTNVADPELPVYESVRRNNFEPVIFTFPIKALSKDSSGVVIEVDKFFTSDVEMISPVDDNQRKKFKIKRLDGSRSMIVEGKSFPKNVFMRHILTYDAGSPPANGLTGTLSLEMVQNFVLLDKKPMMPRLYDQRVGYFSISRYDYGLDEQKAAKQTYITRWRLEPSDPEAFARGEVVEPVKPIVYYVDPATPDQWRPYIKQGIEDWQVAFEAAGFKNAIIAKDPPSKEEDPDWHPEDIRYSVVRYITTPIQNAQGPHVHDPRSGEILESDILWYHNVMNLLRNWYFVQTAAINPKARATKFSDEVMGECIRFVAAHEVGHTLGLPHNMGASNAYHVDSLRSPSFTKKMGTAPSIMDYARFNYIAQPGDGEVGLYPGIGPYDKYSIRWGYRPIPEANSAEAEKATLHQWILEKADEPMYYFGRQTSVPVDPTAQTEDLGHDAMKASEYGIENLKVIMNNLYDWTEESGESYEDLEELYGQILGQWLRYMGHVTANIGGVYERFKTYDQEGFVYEHVSEADQKRALQFLIDQAFETPKWMINEEILRRVESAGTVDRIRAAQASVLSRAMDFSRLARMLENETLNGAKEAYTVLEMMADLRKAVFAESYRNRSVDTYRRNLQRAYVEQLESLLTKDEQKPKNVAAAKAYLGYTPLDASQSDIRPIARGELEDLLKLVKRGASSAPDQMTRYHYNDLYVRIEDALDQLND